MSLKYEPASEPLNISVKKLFSSASQHNMGLKKSRAARGFDAKPAIKILHSYLAHPDCIPPGKNNYKIANKSRVHTLAGPLWEGYRESRICSRDTYPESYIPKYTSIRRIP